MTTRTHMAPAMGTMTRATEPCGIKTKTESNTIAVMMPQAPAFCAIVIPPQASHRHCRRTRLLVALLPEPLRHPHPRLLAERISQADEVIPATTLIQFRFALTAPSVGRPCGTSPPPPQFMAAKVRKKSAIQAFAQVADFPLKTPPLSL